MGTAPRREWGRTVIARDPDQLVWALSARESRTVAKDDPDDEGQVAYQLSDLRKFVKGIGGRIGLEVAEPNVSSFKRRKVMLPDGTFGYRVVRPDWERLMTALRRGECNALAAVDIDRATRDPRILEDLIDIVELYGAYIVSMTGNIDLTTDEGISSARRLVGQRNDESRNTSRRVARGKRKAAAKGKNHGGRFRPYGWRKDRVRLNKREAQRLRDAAERIINSGITAITLAKEWNQKEVPTVSGGKWRATTIRNMFTRPRICGMVTYRDEIMRDEKGVPVRGCWEPILTLEQYEAVVAAWGPGPVSSRLGAKGTGHRTKHLLAPFVRCGKCNARMNGKELPARGTKGRQVRYICPAKANGGCNGVGRVGTEIEEYVTALVIADHERISAVKPDDLPPWPKEKELADLEARISESAQQYEAGNYPGEHYFPSLTRMEATLKNLRNEQRKYSAQQSLQTSSVASLGKIWNSPSFTMDQKHAAIAKTLTTIVIHPVGKGTRKFHPDQITVVFRRDN
nr:recombinase family protein [Kibdelosporangium sp. MJ126-NF4]CEL19255.1 Recombinase [Kibdelosporangium sp. MJ126-NF4]CTQ94946.1 Recombinase [Kibdelosporangium sp. MJ126-NF4]